MFFALFVSLSLRHVQRQQMPATSRLRFDYPILIITFPSSNNMTVFDGPLNDDQKSKTQRVAESQRILRSAFENEVDEVVDEKHPGHHGECRSDDRSGRSRGGGIIHLEIAVFGDNDAVDAAGVRFCCGKCKRTKSDFLSRTP